MFKIRENEMKIKKITVWMIVMAMAVLTVGCGNKIPHNEKENKIKIMICNRIL